MSNDALTARLTVTQLVEAFTDSERNVRAGFVLIAAAEERLNATFTLAGCSALGDHALSTGQPLTPAFGHAVRRNVPAQLPTPHLLTSIDTSDVLASFSSRKVRPTCTIESAERMEPCAPPRRSAAKRRCICSPACEWV